MAAGAGHELNTPLAVISGRAQIMRDKAAGPEDRKAWDQIAAQAHRIGDIISDLMDFASPPRAEPDVVDIAVLMRDVPKAFAASEDPKIRDCRIVVDPPGELLSVIADIAQLRSILREIVTNAAIVAPQVRISSNASHDSDTVVIAIEDSGPGMDAQTLSSVFTPFFSSQRAGRRVGLGLPRAQRYVANNGGRMWIETQPGEGTTVFIELPRADQ